MAHDSGFSSCPKTSTVASGLSVGDVLLGGGEHAARAAGRVEHRADHAGDGERVVVRSEQQVDHQLDDLARGEVLPGGLVGLLREAADQLLEHVPHLVVGHHLGSQVQVGEPAHHLVEQVGAVQPLDLLRELVPLQHLLRVGGEGADVRMQVLGRLAGVGGDAFEGVPAGVVEAVPGRSAQEAVDVHALPGEPIGSVGDIVSRRLQDALQAAQHRERQDHLAVVGLLVVAAQKVGDRPGMVGQFRVLAAVQRGPSSNSERARCRDRFGAPLKHTSNLWRG